MKKVFFFDIDGTLLPLNQDIASEKTVYAIGELQKAGHEVFIATGKSIQHAGWLGEDLNIKNFIATNGQVMVRDGKIEYEKYFSQEDLQTWSQLAKDRNLLLGFQGTYESGVFHGSAEQEAKLKNFFDDVTIDYPERITKIPQFNVGQMWVAGSIEGINPDEQKYHLVKWPHTGGDILPKGSNKAVGIKYYIDHIDANIQTYAFGDGHNDLEMFDFVDEAVAMGNADDIVKARANTVIGHTDDDGIYHYLVKAGLIGAINE